MEKLQQVISKVKEAANARKIAKDREYFNNYFNTMNASTTGSYSQDIAWYSSLMSDQEIQKIVSILKGGEERDIEYILKGNEIAEFQLTITSKKVKNAKFVLNFRFNRSPQATVKEEKDYGYTVVYQEDNINTHWYLIFSYKIKIQ